MILANKQDLTDAMSETEISENLGLTSIKSRQWSIFKCSAYSGFGLNEGMEWLVDAIKSS